MGEATHSIRVARALVTALVLVALFAPGGGGFACGSEPGSSSALMNLAFAFYILGRATAGIMWLVAVALLLCWILVLLRPGSRGAVRAYRLTLMVLCPLAAIGLILYCDTSPSRDSFATTWGWPMFLIAVLLAGALEVVAWLRSRRRPEPPAPRTGRPPRIYRLWLGWALLTALATGGGAAALERLDFLEVRAQGGDDFYSGLARDARYNAPGRADIVLDGEERGATAALGAVGTAVGLLQCLLALGALRRADLRILGGWIGYVVVLGHPSDVLGFLVYVLACSLIALGVGGILVWFRQRIWGLRTVRVALWVLAGPAVLAVALWAVELLPATALRAMQPTVLGLAVWGAALGLVYGTITGAALISGLRLRRVT